LSILVNIVFRQLVYLIDAMELQRVMCILGLKEGLEVDSYQEFWWKSWWKNWLHRICKDYGKHIVLIF